MVIEHYFLLLILTIVPKNYEAGFTAKRLSVFQLALSTLIAQSLTCDAIVFSFPQLTAMNHSLFWLAFYAHITTLKSLHRVIALVFWLLTIVCLSEVGHPSALATIRQVDLYFISLHLAVQADGQFLFQ
jgi:hypothetical protein